MFTMFIVAVILGLGAGVVILLVLLVNTQKQNDELLKENKSLEAVYLLLAVLPSLVFRFFRSLH